MDTTAHHGKVDERPPASTPRLTLSGISKSFPGVRALHNVSLSLYPGQVTALIGENGAGKSTLVKIMTGIYQPDSGEIGIDGVATALPSAHAAFGHGITAIHQETVLFDDLSVAENIVFGLRARRVERRERSLRLERVSALLGLSPLLGRKPSQLSGGQQQRVAIARALASMPQILFADEFTAELDHETKETALILILGVARRGGITVIATHDPEVAARCDTVVHLAEGHIA